MAPGMMEAAVLEEYTKPLNVSQMKVREPESNEVVIKLKVSGVCHTDLHVQDGDWAVKAPLPVVPGHEGVGVVTKVGAGVLDLKVGDRVCTPWLHSACMKCEQCTTGWETLCGNQRNSGFTVNGSFAEYCVATAAFLGRIPDALSDEQAAPICCAGVTVYKALKVTDLAAGEWVSIIGAAGGLGHLAVQYAKYMGLKVIGIDTGKGDFMKQLGCTHTVDAATEDVVAKVLELVPGGVNGAIAISPSVKSMEQSIKYLGCRGKLTLVALPSKTLEVAPFDIIMKALTIRGSIVGTRADLQEALRIAGEGHVRCKVQVRPFKEVNEIMNELREGRVEGRIVMQIE